MLLQIVTEPGWCYVVTLSATGGPATAALPLHLAQLQASPVSHPALGFQQGSTPGAAARQLPPPDALSSHPSRQVDARKHLQKFLTTEQHNSSRLQEQPIDSALAGLSLNGGADASEAARAPPAQQHEDATMSQQKGGDANSGVDDPLRRQDKTRLEHSSQAPAHESKRQPGAAIGSDESSHNSAAVAQRQGPQQAKQAPQQVLSCLLCTVLVLHLLFRMHG